LTIQLRDHGPRIPDEIEKAFEPFYPVEGPRSCAAKTTHSALRCDQGRVPRPVSTIILKRRLIFGTNLGRLSRLSPHLNQDREQASNPAKNPHLHLLATLNGRMFVGPNITVRRLPKRWMLFPVHLGNVDQHQHLRGCKDYTTAAVGEALSHIANGKHYPPESAMSSHMMETRILRLTGR
jgi:hypothetical protein